MSLTNPSIGEYLDRLSILKLKIAYGELAGATVTHFRDEMREIMGKIPIAVSFSADPITKLFAANLSLWQMTDDLRKAIVTKQTEDQRRLGVAILHTNDARAHWIQVINTEHGDLRKEKFPCASSS